jgi:hypothetical protein
MDKIEIDIKQFQKMVFIMNALEHGWKISKKNEKYIFLKKHHGEKKVFLESYLESFIQTNIDISNLSQDIKITKA